jgi:hypothetical protein
LEKVARNCGLHLYYFKLPEVNNRPLRENSPNLVTLSGTDVMSKKYIIAEKFGETTGVFCPNYC